MPSIHPRALDYECRRWLRPNAHLFIRRDWRRFVQRGSELAAYYEYIERKYDPNQRRVPRGNPDGGQWTSGEGGGGSSTADTAREPTAANGRGTQLAQIADATAINNDTRPLYDTGDAALLPPKGVNAQGSTQKLTYHFSDDGQYLGGVTVTNEDRTAVGLMINEIMGTPVHVGFEAQINTINGSAEASFEIKKNLPPGGSITIPWKEFGPMQGPGNVNVKVTNKGSLYTGVIIGANRISSR